MLLNRKNLLDLKRLENAVSGHLGALGYKDVVFVPVSASRGDNVFEVSRNMPWYEWKRTEGALGNTLLDTINSISIPECQVSESFF